MQHLKKSRAVVFGIISVNEILLIRQPDRLYPRWKMPAETIKSGESLASAVKRGLMEEAGLDITLPQQMGRKVVLQNSEVIVGEISPPRHFKSHIRYFYGVILKYPSKLHSLSGKTFPEGINETIRTKVFNVRHVAELPDFLPQQLPLLEMLLQKLPQGDKAA